MRRRIILKRLEGCARCGEEHERMEYVQLERPVRAGGSVFDYWGVCPRRGEPVLMCSHRLPEDAVEATT